MADVVAPKPGLDPKTVRRLTVAGVFALFVAALAAAAQTGAIVRGNPVYDVLVDPFVLMATQPDLLVQTLWEGLVAGVLYALIALGFVLIFKASGVFNFAQGIMVVFAALTLIGLHERGVPAILALILTLGVMLLLAVAVERVVLRPSSTSPTSSCSWRPSG
jgi:branched-chain amino acid transport system permease protein